MGKIIHELKKVSGRLIFPSLISGKTHSGKVLVIKDNSIGDFLLFSGILSFYIRHFGKEQMYCLVSSGVREVAKLYTDNIITLDEKKYFASFKYRYELLSELKSLGFETAINSILNSSESRDILYILKFPLTYLYGGVVMKLRKPGRSSAGIPGQTRNTLPALLVEVPHYLPSVLLQLSSLTIPFAAA